MKLDPLYKIGAKGEIRVWKIETEGNVITTRHGILDGQIQETQKIVKKAKSCETPELQAVFDAQSAWNKKAKEYSPSLEQAWANYENKSLATGGYKPMLAEVYEKFVGQVVYPCKAQFKYDGDRIIAMCDESGVKLFTRHGEPITTMNHLTSQLGNYMERGEIFDGELWNKDMKWNEINSIVSSRVNSKNDFSKINMIVYDVPRIAGLKETDPFEKRFAIISDGSEDYITPNVKIAPTWFVNSPESVTQNLSDALEQGYEGIMLRNPLAPYQNKRTNDLLKVKPYWDEEYLITGWNEGNGKLAGHVATFTCLMPDGNEFKAKLTGETEILKNYFENPEELKKLIGQPITVRHNGIGSKGKPRNPRALRIRKVA